MSRSLVLIVDTGIGSSLLETRFFSPLIAPNERELLNPSVVFNNRLLLPNSLECLDNDNNEYIRDVIGASGSQTSFDLAQCKLGSLGTSSDPRVLPVPRRPGAIESYEPSHGSFVSVLAAGGPDLVFEHPEIARNIGLRFYRVTRPAEGASTKSVRVEPSDMRNAIRYALSQGVSVLNLSMKSSDANLRPLFADGALENTLVVTSAGNRRENLSLEGDRALPAGLSNENLLVVGAVMDNAEGSWWDDSAFGDSVNIAAPGVNVRSFDDTGASVCFTGTSAAAPIVTFTGALLFSFGMQNAKEVKKRILYSAEIDDSLVGKVRHSKRLNVPAAIDIFVDRIVLADTGALLRGRIVADSEERMIRVCSGAEGEPLAGAMGWIDPYYIRSWHLSDGQAMFEDSRNSDTPRSCSIAPSSSLNFRPIGSDDTISILFDAIESIVLSPFRSAEVEGAVLQ